MVEKDGKALGQRIRRIREHAGLSQTDLGNKLGISYQQIQKYERGVNRLSVESLMRMARALGVPVASLLDAGEGPRGGLLAEPRPEYGLPANREERELLKAWREVGDAKVRLACLTLLRAAGRMKG